MRKMYSLIVSFVFVYALSGCTYLWRAIPPSAESIEGALHQANGCSADLQNLQIRGLRPWRQGFVVLYVATCPPQQGMPEAMPQFGHVFVRQEDDRWIHGSGLSLNLSDIHPAEFADMSQANGSDENRQNRFAILFGRAKPEVSTVEVVFDDGSSQKDQITNQLFAVVWDGDVKAVKVRLLGANAELLQEKTLPQLNGS